MSKSSSLVAVLVINLLLFSSAISTLADDGWVNINGNVSYKGQLVCAMVLANGQYTFTCSGDGSFKLTVPPDGNNQITVYAFCSGRAPFKQVTATNLGTDMQVLWTAATRATTVSTSGRVTGNCLCVG